MTEAESQLIAYLQRELAIAKEVLGHLFRAYIHESLRPDVAPSHRFRATLPDGTCRWFPTEEDAADCISDAVLASLKAEHRWKDAGLLPFERVKP